MKRSVLLGVLLLVGSLSMAAAARTDLPGSLAQAAQPWQVMPGSKLLEFAEAFQVAFQLLS